MGLFDLAKNTILRRGIDDPLLQKAMKKVNDIVGEKRRENLKWPLASDPGGRDIYSKLVTDEWWALNHLGMRTKDFQAKRFDSVDSSGWHFGFGQQIAGFDVENKHEAGNNYRQRDTWVEVMHEPVFGWLRFSMMPELWLEDAKESYRRVDIADAEVPAHMKKQHSGRLRGTGQWCALAHLDPLVIRVRTDHEQYDRNKIEALLYSILERLDVDAFASWREEVRAQNGGTGDEPNAEAPPSASEAPALSAPLPSADAIKGGLDAYGGVDLPFTLDAVAAALGAAPEKERAISLPGIGAGTRYQGAGGRALDVILVQDRTLAAAMRAGTVDGVSFAEWNAPEPNKLSYLDKDSDGAHRFVLTKGSGDAYYLRVRGMKYEDLGAPVLAALNGLLAE